MLIYSLFYCCAESSGAVFCGFWIPLLSCLEPEGFEGGRYEYGLLRRSIPGVVPKDAALLLRQHGTLETPLAMEESVDLSMSVELTCLAEYAAEYSMR